MVRSRLAKGQSSSGRNFKEKVLQIVSSIPYGKVTTYGTIATMAGLPRGARLVGGILHYGGEDYPWYRVINRQGFISTKCDNHPKNLQKALLEQEGVDVSEDLMINLQKYGWPHSAQELRGVNSVNYEVDNRKLEK